MKGLKSLREWMLRAFALTIKTVAPTLSVKFLTIWFEQKHPWYKVGSKECARLFLPGVAKEVQAVQRLHLTEDQLKRRVWSEGTCKALLAQGDSSLYFLAKSEEAYNLVTKLGDAAIIAETFRTNTPSVAYLKDWLKTTDKALILAVIEQAPSVFNDLKLDDIKREYAQKLLNSSDTNVSKRWAEKIFEVLVSCFLRSDASKEARELFDKAMKILLETDYDFTKHLENLCSHHWDWYEAVRGKVSRSEHPQSKHLVAYLVERIPKIWFRFLPLEARELSSFEDRSFRGERWGDVLDARAWLQLSYEKLDSQDVIKVALDHITDLQYSNPCGAIVKMQQRLVEKVRGYELIKLALSKLPQQYKSALQSKLYASIGSYAEARECLIGTPKDGIVRIKALPKSYRKGLRAKMTDVLCRCEASEFIRTYWPFLNWEMKNAEQAVRKLASLKKLPLGRLGELSAELQKAGLEEVDVVAEQESLLVDPDECSYPQKNQKELLKRQLNPRSEVVFFTRGYHWQEEKLAYISNFRMSDLGFRALVNHCGNYSDDEMRGRELIRAHAEKWGLTQGEYLLLYNSPYYSDLAAPLKCSKPTELPAENAIDEQETTTEAPNNDEKSE